VIFFYQDWIIYRERDFSLPVCVCVIIYMHGIKKAMGSGNEKFRKESLASSTGEVKCTLTSDDHGTLHFDFECQRFQINTPKYLMLAIDFIIG